MGRIKDLMGNRYGKLTVISRGENDKSHRCTWNCRCDCGNEINIKSANLLHGQVSCGCIRITSLVGKKYGRLRVTEQAENVRAKSGRTHVMYLCKCDCGTRVLVKAENLRSGNTKSCGCLEKDINKEKSTKHGLKGTRIYNVWQGMKQRCYNPNETEYGNYGGRGITVCKEWLGEHGVENFAEWAYSTGYDENAEHGECTIDRIDNDKGYSPDNCRWATNKEQQRNKRNNFVVIYKEKEMTLSEVSEITGINRETLSSRLGRGMTIEEAVSFKKTELKLTFNGVEKTLKEWSAELGVNYRTMHGRYRKGWSVEEVLYGKKTN